MLYTAQGCHLCDLAREELRLLGGELGFALKEIDITDDETLERSYRALIPVVELGGARVSVYGVDAATLEGLLNAQSDGSGSGPQVPGARAHKDW
ncbi:MAG: glutaredoxin family protein [Gaiellaceae bacterium]